MIQSESYKIKDNESIQQIHETTDKKKKRKQQKKSKKRKRKQYQQEKFSSNQNIQMDEEEYLEKQNESQRNLQHQTIQKYRQQIQKQIQYFKQDKTKCKLFSYRNFCLLLVTLLICGLNFYYSQDIIRIAYNNLFKQQDNSTLQQQGSIKQKYNLSQYNGIDNISNQFNRNATINKKQKQQTNNIATNIYKHQQQKQRTRTSSRTQLKQAVKNPKRIRLFIVTKNSKDSLYCSIINSFYIISPITIQSIQNLLQYGGMSTVLIYTDQQAIGNMEIMKTFSNNQKSVFTVHIQQNLEVDSDYRIFLKYLLGQKCQNVAYLQSYFMFASDQATKLKEYMKNNVQKSIAYPTVYQTYTYHEFKRKINKTELNINNQQNKSIQLQNGTNSVNNSINIDIVNNQLNATFNNNSATNRTLFSGEVNQTTLNMTVQQQNFVIEREYSYKQQKLEQLQQQNVENIKLQDISKYLFIIDCDLLTVLSPLNFAYYTKYTFQQLLLYPLLAILQKSSRLYKITQILYNIPERNNFFHYLQFSLKQPPKQNKSKPSLCFVSYTADPYQLNWEHFDGYISSISKNKLIGKSNIQVQISIIIYLPYIYQIDNSNTNNAIGNKMQKTLYQHLQKLLLKQKYTSSINRIKLRLSTNKTLSSHAVYQSSYLYCPQKSIMIASRHNIRFKSNFVLELVHSIKSKAHYYVTNYYFNNDSNVQILNSTPTYIAPFFVRSNMTIFTSFFQHVQIFKTDLLKSMPFWVLKSAQLEFYQTQAVYFVYMMQCLRFNFQYIRIGLFTVLSRSQTAVQIQQMKSLKQYAQYSPLISNILRPYLYNCLQNQAYKRYAGEKIPRKVHQIWLGNANISKIRMKLHQTIKMKNPTYEVTLWKDENITAQNFPLSYYLVSRTLQYQKTSPRSYYALIADVLRYQTLYSKGGIYIDFKMQVLKPLDPFLKYQIFFIDAGIDQSRFVSPVAVGVGIIGAMQNSYYFNFVLNQLINAQNINYNNQYIPALTGGVLVRKAFTDQQLFKKVGFGYQLFIPKPSATDVTDCLKVKQFQPDQEIFQIVDTLTKKIYKAGIPCKQYSQAYIISYKPLANSWKGGKRNMN